MIFNIPQELNVGNSKVMCPVQK